MSWDVKKGRIKRYYYRCQRIDGKVVKRYLGRGAAAEAAAAQDAARKAQRQERRVAQMNADAELVEPALALRQLCSLVDELVRAVLVVNGYHRASRGMEATR